MSDRYLITPSLHSAWRYFHESDDKPKDEILQVLARKEIVPTEAMLAGRKFEEDVQAACEGRYVDFPISEGENLYDKCVHEIAEMVKGGLWQERVMKDATFRNMNFLLYGKADVIRRDWIYDIKFVSQYDVGKYNRSVQHLLYCACTGAEKFGYLISDGRSVWREDYFFPDAGALMKKLTGELVDMIDNIMSSPEFSTAYIANWKSFNG